MGEIGENGGVWEKKKDMENLLNIIAKKIEQQLTSPVYGTYLVAWICWNWEILYITFFTSEDKLLLTTGELKIDYLKSIVAVIDFSPLSISLEGVSRMFVPMFVTYIIIVLLPKKILLPALQYEQDYKVEKRKIQFESEKIIAKYKGESLDIKENLINKEKEILKNTPEVLWEKEFQNSIGHEVYKTALGIMSRIIYEHGGNIYDTDPNTLAILDTRELGKLSDGKMIPTEKGRYFLKRFIDESFPY